MSTAHVTENRSLNEPDGPFPDPARVAAILATVPRVTAPKPSRRIPVKKMIGMWKMPNPPDDAECRRIIEEERMRRPCHPECQ